MGLSNAEEMMHEQLEPLSKRRPAGCAKETHSLLFSHSDSSASDGVAECATDIASTSTVDASATANAKVNGLLPEHGDEECDDDDDDRPFIAMEMEEMDAIDSLHRHRMQPPTKGPHRGHLRVLKKAPAVHSQQQPMVPPVPPPAVHRHHEDGPEMAGAAAPPSRCQRGFECLVVPFHIAFKWTVPSGSGGVLDEAKTSLLVGSFCVVLVWLGLLTFVCVDAAEKMGNCLRINEDVMGLTLLAIGSSLPDCFSSVLAAKQGKGEMAVSNALGSNVFDINICIGVSFLASSVVKGFKAIHVEHDEGFELFIAALFVLLAIFMVAMFCYGLVLNKNIGAGLMAAYAVFLGAFCYLLQFD